MVAWSDDQKSYFILRLKDIDSQFSDKYEHYLEFGKDSPDKDYFEPGVPTELDLSLHKDESTKPPEFNPVKNLIKDKIIEEGKECGNDEERYVECYYLFSVRKNTDNFLGRCGDGEESVNLEKYQTDDDLCKPSSALCTIDEDSGHLEEEETND